MSPGAFSSCSGLAALGIAARFRDAAERVSRRRFLQALVFVPLFFLAEGLLELPPAAYEHHLSRVYEQSVQGWGSWLGDQAKGFAVGIAVGVPLVWILYGILRRSPKRWWLWFWLVSIPVLVLFLFATPIVVDPLFFRFTPLAPRQPELAGRIEEVTKRVGLPIPRDRMFEMNASTKWKSVNAYVTGLAASKRVVVWDTTIARMTIPQTLFVFGHEMGHYVLHHVRRTILFLLALLLPVLFLAARWSGRIVARAGPRWRIRSPADWASLPVLLVTATILAEVLQPVVNSYSRSQEHAADVFGLEAIHGIVPDSSRIAAESFQILGEVNLSDPNPPAFIRVWLYSHPPLADRLRFAATYDPWSRGEEPRYVKPRT